MKVRMVHIVHDTTVSYSHGLASLAGVLQQDIQPTSLDLVTVRTPDVDPNVELLLDGNPDFLLFTAMSNQWNNACRLARKIRTYDQRPCLLVGGSHVIAAPLTARSSPFDVAVVGEGEIVLPQLVERREIRDECRVINGPIVDDLSQLPMPNIAIFDVPDILAYPSVMFSRGCPYKCNYCMSRMGGLGGQIRWKAPSRALAEVSQLVEYAHAKEVYIDDDTFLKNPAWVREFSDAYAETIGVPFYCNARPETIRADLCRRLAAAGCLAIGIGIESGSERIRRDVLNRRMSDAKIIQAFDIAHAAGMKTWSFNMVGIPGETADDLRATIDLNDRVATDYVRVSVYTPYPGTPLYTENSELTYTGGYIRPSSVLEPEMSAIYDSWLRRLAQQDRLWFTDSEAALL